MSITITEAIEAIAVILCVVTDAWWAFRIFVR